MKSRVFISYRRADAIHLAARIKQSIEKSHRDVEVFWDVDTMPFVSNFVAHVQEQVRASNLLIAVLSPGWAGSVGADGRRRIDDVNDVVRIEIAAALEAGIPLVPVAADGASFPKTADLPSELSALAQHSGVEVRGATFDADMALLLDRLTPLIRRGAVAVATGRPSDRQRRWIVPGDGKTNWFKDVEGGPELVVVPAGRFTMGSPLEEPGREPVDSGSETQTEQVVPRSFAIGRAPVTVEQFSQFVSATGKEPPAGAYRWSEARDDYSMSKSRSWRDLSGEHPVACISWADAVAFAAWLSELTGWHYRLPSCAEWEYAARAGTMTPLHGARCLAQ